MNIDDWARDHPTRPTQLMQLVSAKRRANGRSQSAYSSRHKRDHPYQIIKAVLDWNQPLRDDLRTTQQKLLRKLQGESLSAVDKAKIELEISRLQKLQKTIWLYLRATGEISTLDLTIRYTYVNVIFKENNVLFKGKALQFSQSLSRKTWAIFAYQTSGYNTVVAQLALGHKDLYTLLHYIDQKSVRNRNRRAFFDFQTHVLNEVSKGRLNPRILKALVERGELSPEEAAHLASGGTRSRQGITCANPHSPDIEVAPNHRPGDCCATQNCLDGCSKAFATLEALEYVALRILELRRLKSQMPLLAWASSNYPHDLQFLYQLFERFSDANRKAAMKKAEASQQPLFFTQPSIANLQRAG